MTDQDLRRVILDVVPPLAEPPDRIEIIGRRVRRQRLGQFGASVAAGVAVLAVAATSATLLSGGGHASLPVGVTPTQAATTRSTAPVSPAVSPMASPAAAPPRTSRVPLAPPTLAPITFPLTPTFTPAGLPTPTEGRTVGTVRLVYTVAPDSVKGIIASVNDRKPYFDLTPRTTEHITVSGHPATLYTGTSEGQLAVGIVWKLHGKWVAVEAGALSVADVERYANGLVESPRTPTPLPFTLAVAPQGYVIDFQEIHPEYPTPTFYFNMSTPADIDDQLSHNMLGLVASVENTAAATGTPIQVGAYPAKLNIADGMMSIYVLRPGFTYEVLEMLDGPLSQADLIRFAAGVAPR